MIRRGYVHKRDAVKLVILLGGPAGGRPGGGPGGKPPQKAIQLVLGG